MKSEGKVLGSRAKVFSAPGKVLVHYLSGVQ